MSASDLWTREFQMVTFLCWVIYHHMSLMVMEL